MVCTIGFVTCSDYPNLHEDDLLAVKELNKAGIKVEPVIWNNPDIDYNKYIPLVVRSTWDYHEKYTGFLKWLDYLENEGLRTLNPVSILKWNSDKIYLKELQQRGIKIIDTEWITNNSQKTIADIMGENDWNKAIVKPTVSAGSRNTWITDKQSVSEIQANINLLLPAKSFMVQEFVESIATEGEWSLIYINKSFSHCVKKTPKKGDFRSQPQFGSRIEPVTPLQSFIETGEAILNSIDADLLYARVDGLNINGEFRLMELELLEPRLFLGYSKEAPSIFSNAVQERL